MKLTLDDIADLRAYERERDEFRARIIELKRIRRVSVGPVVTLVFENRDTIRFQIQEMARAERILTDEGIQAELDVYNALIPSAGQLSATLFVELTSEEEMRHWLPRLVGIERSVVVRVGGTEVRCIPEEEHEAQLTRDAITASVHYIRFEFTPEQVEAFSAGPAHLAVDHPDYREETELSEATRMSLLGDLRGGNGGPS
ncbi:MAG: DUF3501 family protein [Acidimicrobiales bacterium]